MTEPIWTVETVKEYIEKILEEKDRATDQRFRSQEKAIETAENARDVAISKAENSIEKKSDAVYVKLGDLQKALAEIMLRPEVESRFSNLSDKVDQLRTYSDNSMGKSSGRTDSWGYLVGAIGLLGGIIGIVYAFIR